MVELRPGASLNDCHLDGVLRALRTVVCPLALSVGGQTECTAIVILLSFGRYLIHMAGNFQRYRWYE